LGGAVFLWVAGQTLETWMRLPATLLSSAVVALGAVALLSIEEVIDWNDLRGVNWGVFFVIGAGLTLGDALNKTGASAWFAEIVSPMLIGLPYTVILMLLISGAFVLTQFMNNVTLGAIWAPILISLGQASGIAPQRLLLPAIMSLALAYMLPSASARMTLVSVTGAVERKDMMRAGLIVGIPSAFFILFFFSSLVLFQSDLRLFQKYRTVRERQSRKPFQAEDPICNGIFISLECHYK
jgi:sodium-dependent dicarboxylate transporter 2/3/5